MHHMREIEYSLDAPLFELCAGKLDGINQGENWECLSLAFPIRLESNNLVTGTRLT